MRAVKTIEFFVILMVLKICIAFNLTENVESSTIKTNTINADYLESIRVQKREDEAKNSKDLLHNVSNYFDDINDDAVEQLYDSKFKASAKEALNTIKKTPKSINAIDESIFNKNEVERITKSISSTNPSTSLIYHSTTSTVELEKSTPADVTLIELEDLNNTSIRSSSTELEYFSQTNTINSTDKIENLNENEEKPKNIDSTASRDAKEETTEEKKTQVPSESDKKMSKSQLMQIYKYLKKKNKEQNEEDLLHKLHDKLLLNTDHEKHTIENEAAEDTEDIISHMLPYTTPYHENKLIDLYNHYHDFFFDKSHERPYYGLMSLLENNPLLKNALKNKNTDFDLNHVLNSHDANPFSISYHHPYHDHDHVRGSHFYDEDYINEDPHYNINEDPHQYLLPHDHFNYYQHPYHNRREHLDYVNEDPVGNHYMLPHNHFNYFHHPYWYNGYHNHKFLKSPMHSGRYDYDNFGHPIYGDPDHTSSTSELYVESIASPYCLNYPDHSTEGFKNFIAVETCNGPIGINSGGIPVFYNGCTFRYACENGYQPFQGPLTSISCNSGNWNNRAICIKEGTNLKIKRDESNPSDENIKSLKSKQNTEQNSNMQPINAIENETSRNRRNTEEESDDANKEEINYYPNSNQQYSRTNRVRSFEEITETKNNNTSFNSTEMFSDKEKLNQTEYSGTKNNSSKVDIMNSNLQNLNYEKSKANGANTNTEDKKIMSVLNSNQIR